MPYFIETLFGPSIYLFSIQVVMESPVKDRSAVDKRETVQRNKVIVPYQIDVHALSGCDTVAANITLVMAR